MGVDFYPCSRCGDIYCDCGYFVTCCEDKGGCGRDWCSDDCAKEDEYEVEHCKLDKDIVYGHCRGECELSDDACCTECINYIPSSCSYCRHENYEDSELLNKALELLEITREDLISKMK